MASSKTESNTTWTAPRTWTAGELVTAAMMNGVRDQLGALATPAYAYAHVDEAANFTTSSTSFAEMDSTGTQLELTVTTAGRPVEVHFTGRFSGSGGAYTCNVDITCDGVQLGTEDGFAQISASGGDALVSIGTLVPTLAAGSHTFKVMGKVSNGAATLTLNCSTTTHPVFWVKEIG